MSSWWEYEELESGDPYDWSPAAKGNSEWDNIDFHLDLGCGRLPKARLGIDRYWTPGVDLMIDLDNLIPSGFDPEIAPDEAQACYAKTVGLYDIKAAWGGLPFPDNSIHSIVSHHAMEHLAEGFVPLIDECHRVLRPGGVLRIIVPLFPSTAAVEDPDHCRYFMVNSFECFCGDSQGNHWMESFSHPYTKARFELVDKDYTPPPTQMSPPEEQPWGDMDKREIRVALRKWDT